MAKERKAYQTRTSYCGKLVLGVLTKHFVDELEQVTANARSEQIAMAQEAGMVSTTILSVCT